MSQASSKLRIVEGGGVSYWCQGCNEMHSIKIGGGDSPRWGYNGNPEKPTFTPSVLVRSGHYASHYKPGEDCWCTHNKESPDDLISFNCQICHTFITDGRVQFLGDCTHALAGQTLPLPDLPKKNEG